MKFISCKLSADVLEMYFYFRSLRCLIVLISLVSSLYSSSDITVECRDKRTHTGSNLLRKRTKCTDLRTDVSKVQLYKNKSEDLSVSYFRKNRGYIVKIPFLITLSPQVGTRLTNTGLSIPVVNFCVKENNIVHLCDSFTFGYGSLPPHSIRVWCYRYSQTNYDLK